ncbi:MAG TPA: hypothetical protein VN603_12525 [Candidatus Acidoferrales bacterium]|jgi:CHASE2 domain-containing sensor protein|nr:hypothetical protein [Candidatus Acidoferrales bacterium]
MREPESDDLRPENRSSVLAAGAVAILVCVALIGLFVWQPWSPTVPALRPASASAK